MWSDIILTLIFVLVLYFIVMWSIPEYEEPHVKKIVVEGGSESILKGLRYINAPKSKLF
jgi:hypothetical protein